MSEMYPEEEEPEEEEQDEQSRMRSEAEGRTFFAFLCFFIAIILLALFVNGGLETSVKLLVLFGVIGFGILGVLIFEKKQPITPIANDTEDEPGEQVQEEFNIEEPVEEAEESDQARELTPFEQLVREALEAIPAEFHDKMENLAVIVKDEPDEETLARVGSAEGQTLLGLYQGVPLTAQGYGYAMLPQQITIYQHTIERYCHGDPDLIREQVQHTVLHEVAHHFGIGHEAMPIWVR